ncbi:MAG: rRNA pseudouridine synthase [Ruminococcaceae bacterium]|nr:rRNA pseudouridine synthase [Oscillospiraceae bacterium]
MRIDKLLANSTPLGRKEIKQYIRKGQVRCNDKVITDPGTHVDENNDEITMNGERVTYSKHTYLMLNKPDGYISATFDKHYPVVTELVPEEFSHVELFPVGRLDIDTHGLLLLTNNGDLAHRLLSPKSQVPKTYFVKSAKPVNDADIETFAKGIELEPDFTTLPAKLEPIADDKLTSHVTIYEGKFHQVKRMFEAIDNEVLYLKRLSMGSLVLDETLSEGECRPLTEDEISDLIQGLS